MTFRPWYKRNYLIDPKVQLKVVSLLGFIAFICAVVICFLAFERLMKLEVLFNRSIVPPAMLPEAFMDIAKSLMFRLIGLVTLMIFVFIAAGVYLTHQLAGPIFKLQAELKKYHAGEQIPALRFRKNDAFQELPELINKLIQK
jgi:hypothetical protein